MHSWAILPASFSSGCRFSASVWLFNLARTKRKLLAFEHRNKYWKIGAKSGPGYRSLWPLALGMGNGKSGMGTDRLLETRSRGRGSWATRSATISQRSRAEQPNSIKLIANMINCTLTWIFIANYIRNMPMGKSFRPAKFSCPKNSIRKKSATFGVHEMKIDKKLDYIYL